MSADHIEPRENKGMGDCEDAEDPGLNKKADLLVLEDLSLKVLKPKICTDGKEDGVQNSADGDVGEQYEMMLKKDDVEGADGSVVGEARGETLDLRCGCRHLSSRMGYAVIVVMTLSNVLNYMDRFTIAGISSISVWPILYHAPIVCICEGICLIGSDRKLLWAR